MLYVSTLDSYNIPFITRLLPGVPLTVIRLVGRTVGLYTAEGNPSGITGLEDLARDGLRLANREKGSGARVLLDELLMELSIDRNRILGYDQEYGNHLSVASAIARGDADLGLGAEEAAVQTAGVNFIPLQTEWYDLVFLREREQETTFRLMVDYLTGGDFQTEVSATGNYDLSQTGMLRHI